MHVVTSQHGFWKSSAFVSFGTRLAYAHSIVPSPAMRAQVHMLRKGAGLGMAVPNSDAQGVKRTRGGERSRRRCAPASNRAGTCVMMLSPRTGI